MRRTTLPQTISDQPPNMIIHPKPFINQRPHTDRRLGPRRLRAPSLLRTRPHAKIRAHTHTHTHPQTAHTRHACVWSKARRVRALSTPASPVRRPAAAAKYSRLPKIRARGAPRAGRGTGGRRPPRGAPGSTPSPASERRPTTGARPHAVTLVVRCCVVWPHWMSVAPIFENVPFEVAVCIVYAVVCWGLAGAARKAVLRDCFD